VLISLPSALSAAAAATAAAATTSDKLEVTATAAAAAAIADVCQATKRPGHHRRFVVEEADPRRGRPLRLADPEPTTIEPRLSEPVPVKLVESPHRRGGWRPPRRAKNR
jgi:hypothetical protein